MTVIVVMLAVAIILFALFIAALMRVMPSGAPQLAPPPARLPVAARRPVVVIDVEAREHSESSSPVRYFRDDVEISEAEIVAALDEGAPR